MQRPASRPTEKPSLPIPVATDRFGPRSHPPNRGFPFDIHRTRHVRSRRSRVACDGDRRAPTPRSVRPVSRPRVPWESERRTLAEKFVDSVAAETDRWEVETHPVSDASSCSRVERTGGVPSLSRTNPVGQFGIDSFDMTEPMTGRRIPVPDSIPQLGTHVFRLKNARKGTTRYLARPRTDGHRDLPARRIDPAVP